MGKPGIAFFARLVMSITASASACVPRVNAAISLGGTFFIVQETPSCENIPMLDETVNPNAA